MTPYEAVARIVGEEKAGDVLDALSAAGFTIARDVDRFSLTWQADH